MMAMPGFYALESQTPALSVLNFPMQFGAVPLMREPSTKMLITLALLASSFSPVSATSISSKDAIRHSGQTVSVSGRATLTVMLSGEVYIDLDGRWRKRALCRLCQPLEQEQFPEPVGAQWPRLSGLPGRSRPSATNPRFFCRTPPRSA